MKVWIVLTIMLSVFLLAGCMPNQMGPSFEPKHEGSGWDYGDRLNMAARFTASPVLVNDRVYLASLDGNIFAFELDKGKRINAKSWSFKIPQGIRATPVHNNGILYFGAFDKCIHGVDITTAQGNFVFKTGGYISGSPVIIDNVLFCGSYDGIFRGIDLNSNRNKWEFDSGSPIRGGCAATIEGIVFSNKDGDIFHLDRDDGSELWKFENDAEIYGSPAVSDSLIIIADRKANVIALHVSDGSLYWKFTADKDGFQFREEFWVTPTIDEDAVFIGSNWGRFYSFKLHPENDTYEFFWEPFITHSDAKGTPDSIMSEASIYNKKTIFIDNTRESTDASDSVTSISEALGIKQSTVDILHIISSVAGRNAYAHLVNQISSRFVLKQRIERKILFGANDHKLYCLDRDSGEELWAFTTLGEIRCNPLIVDDKVIFISNDHYLYGLNIEDGTTVGGT